MIWIQSCLGLPYSRPSPPASFTSLVAKMPVAIAPQVPPTPCTPTTSSESSYPSFDLRLHAR